MTKKHLNKINSDELLEVIRGKGLTVELMAAFNKCSDENGGPARIYVAKTQKVSRVHLAGFTLNRPGVRQISEREARDLRMGSVRGELDFTEDRSIVLEALSKACEAVKIVNRGSKKAVEVLHETVGVIDSDHDRSTTSINSLEQPQATA